MNNEFKSRIYIFLLLGIQLVRAEVKSASACHSSGQTDCNYITLECNAGYKIRILTMKYGIKMSGCKSGRNQCQNSGGCCAYDPNDCFEYYNDLHAYNLHDTCSRKQQCPNLPVPRKLLPTCNGSVSTYVHVQYECIPESAEIAFCDKTSQRKNSSSLFLLFDKTTDQFDGPKTCSCFVKSNATMLVDLVDVRMLKLPTSETGSACSSASLLSNPYKTDVNTSCVATANEEINFKYEETVSFDTSPLEIKLLDLYKTGKDDAPQLIWINVVGKNQQPVEATCFRHVDGTTQVPISTGTRTTTGSVSRTTGGSGNTTNINNTETVTGDDGVNTGAVVAGVLVPVFLIVGGIVLFIFIRRRKDKAKRLDPSASRAYLENSIENNEYAEIGFVPDLPVAEPTYDPVYEPKHKHVNRDKLSFEGHTYQNTGAETRTNTRKGPLATLKSHTDRLISFFKKQTENDFPPVKSRESDASAGSYDHLRPDSTSTNVTVEITPPTSESANRYSHTNDAMVNKNATNKDNNVNKKGKCIPNPSPKSSKRPVTEEHSTKSSKRPVTEEPSINAVHIGDAYIEFQFGAEDHPNVLKGHLDDNAVAPPVPPNRPPPSPRLVANMKVAHNNQATENPNETKSRTPNFLSPQNKSEESQPTYDYATQHVHSRSASNASQSDVSSEHSYKILEPQQVYDYADVSDSELADAVVDQPGGVYEDVDKDRGASCVQKHKSSTEAQYSSDGYLAPITNRRAASSPGLSETSASQPDTNATKTAKPKEASKTSLLKREMQDKFKQKTQNITSNKEEKGMLSNEERNNSKGNDVVKCDNVKTKDYQDAKDVKGVMKMAQMFESKGSDSDTSQQNSPRNVNRTSSDA